MSSSFFPGSQNRFLYLLPLRKSWALILALLCENMSLKAKLYSDTLSRLHGKPDRISILFQRTRFRPHLPLVSHKIRQGTFTNCNMNDRWDPVQPKDKWNISPNHLQEVSWLHREQLQFEVTDVKYTSHRHNNNSTITMHNTCILYLSNVCQTETRWTEWKCWHIHHKKKLMPFFLHFFYCPFLSPQDAYDTLLVLHREVHGFNIPAM